VAIVQLLCGMSFTCVLFVFLSLLRLFCLLVKELIVDMSDLIFISVRDKDNLWQKSNKLSNERRVRRSNCWRNSADILKCMACNADFTVTLRKVFILMLLLN